MDQTQEQSRDWTESIQSNQDAPLTEARVADILEHISDAFYAVDENWRLTYVNRQAEQIWGRRREDLIGKNIWEEFPQAVGSQAHNEIQRAVRERRTVAFEYVSPPLDRWLAVRVVPHEWGLYVYFQDITEQKQAEEALVQKSAHLQLLFDVAAELLTTEDVDRFVDSVYQRLSVLIGLDGYFHYRTIEGKPGLLRLAGYSGIAAETAAQIKYLKYGEVVCGTVAKERTPIVVESVQHSTDPRTKLIRTLDVTAYACFPLMTQSNVYGTVSFFRRGQDRFVPDQLSLMRSVCDQIATAIERKQAETALRESEARFRTIFEGSAIGIGLVDREGRVVESNLALQQLLGYSRDELHHMVFTKFTHPDDRQADLALYHELVAGKRTHYQLEKRYLRKDRQVIWGRLTVSLVQSAEGEPQFAIRMVEDITEHKRVAAELVKARRWLAESREAERLHLARELHDSTIQHLLGISYLLDTLRRSTGAGQHADASREAGLVAALNSIHGEVLAAVSQLRGLISDLRPAGLEDLGLTAALEGYVARLQREQGSARPEVVLNLDQSGTALPKLVAFCLFRTAQEALRNALQHAQAQQILLQLRLSPREVVLRVRDDGCGFQVPAHLSALAQADHFGLLGMAEWVALVGGRLTIQSQPGAGTEVTVHIPLGEGEHNDDQADSRGVGR